MDVSSCEHGIAFGDECTECQMDIETVAAAARAVRDHSTLRPGAYDDQEGKRRIMAAPRRWIRLDVGWSDSEWLAELAPAGRLAWVELLTYAKSEGLGGVVKPITPAIFSRKFGIPAGDVTAMLEAAENDGALIVDDGQWIINGWPDYQETDPTAAARQRKYRADRSRLSSTRQNRGKSVDNGVSAEATSKKPVTPVTVGVTPVTRNNRNANRDPSRDIDSDSYRDKEENADANASGKPNGSSFPQSTTAVDADISDGDLMSLVRKHFYAPDGKPPSGYQEGREFSCFKLLRQRGKSGVAIARVIEGAAAIRDDNGLVRLRPERLDVDWLKRGDKLTMRALVNAKSGVTDLWQLAEVKMAEIDMAAGKGKTAWENGALKIQIVGA